MFASAIAIDLLQARDNNVPSLDDWGTAQEACARTALQILCSSVGPDVFYLALPTWLALRISIGIGREITSIRFTNVLDPECGGF